MKVLPIELIEGPKIEEFLGDDLEEHLERNRHFFVKNDPDDY